MNTKKMTLGLLCSFGFMFMMSSGASAQWSPYWGGAGGSAYNFSCGSVPLTELTVYAGDYIDSIQGICWNGSQSPKFGGNGGSGWLVDCTTGYDANQAMTGVSLYSGGWVLNALSASCQGMRSGVRHNIGWVGTRSGTYSSFRCGGNKAIKQFRGGAGVYVDSLSVYCGDY